MEQCEVCICQLVLQGRKGRAVSELLHSTAVLSASSSAVSQNKMWASQGKIWAWTCWHSGLVLGSLHTIWHRKSQRLHCSAWHVMVNQ